MKTIGWLAMMTMLLLAACGGGSGGGETPTEALASPTEAESAATESSEGEAAESPGGEGLCANRYYPVALGVSHTYTGTGGPEGAYSFTTTITEVRADGFTLTTEFEGLTLTHQWSCTAEGLQPLEYGGGAAATLSTGGSEAQFTTSDVSGVLLPATISVGDTWGQTFEVAGTQTIPGAGTADSTGTVTYTFEALGEESISTAAGDFTALAIATTTTLGFQIDIEGVSTPLLFESTGTTYYAEGIGLVGSTDHAEVFGIATDTTIDLTAYGLP